MNRVKFSGGVVSERLDILELIRGEMKPCFQASANVRGHILRFGWSESFPFTQAKPSNAASHQASHEGGRQIRHHSFLRKRVHWESARFKATSGRTNSAAGSLARSRRLSAIMTIIKTEAKPSPRRKN